MRREVPAKDRDLSRGRQHQTEQHCDRRRLARAVAAKKRCERALRGCEAYAIDRENVTITLDQALDGNRGLGSAGFITRPGYGTRHCIHFFREVSILARGQ